MQEIYDLDTGAVQVEMGLRHGFALRPFFFAVMMERLKDEVRQDHRVNR